jgi:hypothetical protein
MQRRIGRRIALGFAVGVVVLLAWAWKGRELKDHLIVRNFGVVVEGEVYRSGRLSTTTLRRVIRENGIRTVVDLGAYDHRPEQGHRIRETADELGVTKFDVTMIGDGRANPNGYVEVLRILADPQRRPVLVQCSPIQEAYPEAFLHGHEPDSWKMLAYVADWAGAIGDAYRTGRPIPGVPPIEARPDGAVDARGDTLPVPAPASVTAAP